MSWIMRECDRCGDEFVGPQNSTMIRLAKHLKDCKGSARNELD